MKELSTEFRVRLQQEITMREEAETTIIKQVIITFLRNKRLL